MQMLRFRLSRLALMLTVTAGALLAPKAHADFNVHNNYHRPIWVAFAYANSDACGGEGGGYKAMGWYKVDPGATRALLHGSLLFGGKYFYLYANSDDGAEWSGDYYTYVINEAFNTCWDYGHSTSDGPNQWELKGFFEVEIGTFTSDHTVNFN
jgi:uncharacterized membrane protein